MKKPMLAILSSLLVIGIAIVAENLAYNNAKYMYAVDTYAEDYSIIEESSYVAETAYEDYGLVYEDATSFSNSILYPYVDGLPDTPHGAKVKFTVKDGIFHSRMSGLPGRYVLPWRFFNPDVEEYKTVNNRYSFPLDQTEDELTRKRTRFFIKPTIESNSVKLSDFIDCSSCKPKSVNNPTFDVQSLARAFGESNLLDGWKKPMKFFISEGRKVALSSGADGIFGTPDDIEAKSDAKK